MSVPFFIGAKRNSFDGVHVLRESMDCQCRAPFRNLLTPPGSNPPVGPGDASGRCSNVIDLTDVSVTVGWHGSKPIPILPVGQTNSV
ncbi:MAG: hypothetical protein E5Y02_10385 [Mesorhizobium sp.]|nr:MAG: hypothetical protein E5Y02_10385 [Mesorhizobium sp.]